MFLIVSEIDGEGGRMEREVNDDDDDDDDSAHVYSAMVVRIPTGVQHPGTKQTRDAYQLQLFTPQFCFHSIKRGPWGVGRSIKPVGGNTW